MPRSSRAWPTPEPCCSARPTPTSWRRRHDDQSVLRHDPQSARPHAHPRRIQRRLGGRGRGRPRPGGHRQRHRRQRAHPGRAVRLRRAQADLRPGEHARAARRLPDLRSRWRAGPHRRGRRVDVDGDGWTRSAGSALGESPAGRLHRRRAGGCQGAAHRRDARVFLRGRRARGRAGDDRGARPSGTEGRDGARRDAADRGGLFDTMFGPIITSEIQATYAAEWKSRPEAFSKRSPRPSVNRPHA